MTAPAAVRERPILFSGPMVRAILDGSKTQTRRVVTPQPPEWIDNVGYSCFTPAGHISGRGYWKGVPGDEGPGEKFIPLRYGARGDRLWVRETWRAWATVGAGTEVRTEYQADGREVDRHLDDWSVPRSVAEGGWGPSIFMPRWACRLVLELTDVRVERIRDISAADCRAEGAPGGDTTNELGWRYSFGSIWNELNEKRGYGWIVNPWVWVLSFRRVEP